MKRIIGKIIISFILIIWIAPFFWLIATSLTKEKDIMTDNLVIFPSQPTFQNYEKAFRKTSIGIWLLNSAIIATAATIFTILLDTTMAFTLSRIKFRGRNALFIFVIAGMMIPFEVLIVQLYLMFNAIGLVNNIAAMIIPRMAMPIGVFILAQFFKGIPVALEEAAYIDGASRFIVYKSIIIPLSKSAIAAVAIIAFIGAWNDFLWPLVIASETAKYTVTIGIANFQGTHGTEYSLIMAGAVLASIPEIFIFLFFRKNIVKGIAMTGIKG